ncbi:MAG: phytanoyl-CoA dioxygenase family protein [Polyangiales bacterium]
MSDSSIAARFRTDGFVVVPGFLDAREVERMRALCVANMFRGERVGGGTCLADLQHHLPEAHALVTDPRSLAVARALVGPRVLDVHQNAVHRGTVNRGWHKDAVDYMQGRPDGPDWADDYRIVHFAWYLQDHTEFAGGISFRRGSHRIKNHRDGEVVTPPLRAGDLVAFDLRTSHFGNTIQLRDGRTVFLDRLWRSKRPPWSLTSRAVRRLKGVFRPEHGDGRLVIFAMYGADDAHTHRFFGWLRTQPDLRHVLRYDGPTLLQTASASTDSW